jgi:hypothetical protein
MLRIDAPSPSGRFVHYQRNASRRSGGRPPSRDWVRAGSSVHLEVERSLLWNQTSSVSRGIQVNYISGPVSLASSWKNRSLGPNRFGEYDFTLSDSAAIRKVETNICRRAYGAGRDAAHTHGANFDRTPHPFAQAQTQGTHFGYAAARALWPSYVPSRGIQGESCGDAFQPICR